MTRKLKITEKTIGVFHILWGGAGLLVAIWTIKYFFDFGFEHLDISWEDFSILKIIKNYHSQVLLPLLTLFAGVALILNKRIGWFAALVTSALNGIQMVLWPWTIENEEMEETLVYAFAGFISLIFITIVGLLLTKQIRSKYNPSKKDWVIMSITFTLLLVDKLFL